MVDCGALEGLVTCLEEFDPGVKEAACWTLGYVAGHSPELAQQVNHNTPRTTHIGDNPYADSKQASDCLQSVLYSNGHEH